MNKNIKIVERNLAGFEGVKALFAIDKRDNSVICFRRYEEYYNECSDHIFKSEEWEANSLDDLKEWFRNSVEKFHPDETR